MVENFNSLGLAGSRLANCARDKAGIELSVAFTFGVDEDRSRALRGAGRGRPREGVRVGHWATVGMPIGGAELPPSVIVTLDNMFGQHGCWPNLLGGL